MESLTSALQTAASESVREAIRAGAQILHKAGVANARLDAEVLLRDVLGIEQTEIALSMDEALCATAEREFHYRLLRRAAREPAAYITGRKEFWSLDFVVTPAVLIPRPETELLVEMALARATIAPPHPSLSPVFGGEGKGEGAKDSGSGAFVYPKILDLGTGSGAIAVSLAKELAQARVCAVDISAAAIEIARLNARRLGVEERIEFFCGDLFGPLAEEGQSFDLIVANPPYIRSSDFASLAPEIQKWEPIVALDGGADGLFYYRRIISVARGYLRNGARILLELGDGMGEAVARLFADTGGFAPAQVYRDYAGKERVITAAKLFPAADMREGSDHG